MPCSHTQKTLTEEDRLYIKSADDNNCVSCLIEKLGRPLSQAEVAQLLDISKMRVSQIERVALKKFTRRFGMKYGRTLLLTD
jgi:predicted XRE-type DNA-binding protein